MTPRWPALVLVVALVVGGLVATGGAADDGAEPARPVEPASLIPSAVPDDALGSVWYCAGQTAGDETAADGTVVIANVGDEASTGRVEVVDEDGAREGLEVEVPAATTRRVRLAEVLEADWVAARVELDGGTVVVEHEVAGPEGRDVAPCHTAAGTTSYLPSGATTRDASLRLAIYNPYPDAATVDLSFATTETSQRQPSDFQGIPIEPGGLRVVDVTPVVTVVPVAATTVTARQGRVVVDRVQIYDGRGASTTDEAAAEEDYRRQGLTLTPAVRTPRTVWSLPAGARSGAVHERVVVFNPGEEEAEVEVQIDLDDPERNGRLDPFPLTVPAGQFATFDLGEVEALPDGVYHSLVVRSPDVPVVAERWLDNAGADASYLGVATSTGSPVAALRWAFASGRADPTEELERIVLSNPGEEEATVTLVATGDGESVEVGDGPVTVGAGGRVEVDLGELDLSRPSILVEASAPVVAERRLLTRPAEEGDDGEAGEPGLGTSVALGVPLPPGLVPLR